MAYSHFGPSSKSYLLRILLGFEFAPFEKKLIRPTEKISTVTTLKPPVTPTLWGLMPKWESIGKSRAPIINVRSETVHEKPSFKALFQNRRCLLPATGFWEFAEISAKRKQPYFFRMKDESLFAFAGLYDDDNGTLRSAIITTKANNLVRDCNDRMPAILKPDDIEAWLSPDSKPDDLLALLKPYSDDEMLAIQDDPNLLKKPSQSSQESLF
ncbi:SOS response-associated peptidase [bacterium]|nr:SOS response-associated peptidase [bacterium]